MNKLVMALVLMTSLVIAPSTTVTAATSASARAAREADPVCEAARKATKTAGACALEDSRRVSAASIAAPEQLQADGALRSPSGTSLKAAAATRTIWTRTWSQTQRGLYYVNWWEKHSGRIYFDKKGHVWSTTKTYGYKGTHICGQGGGVGYSVKVKQCFVEKRHDLSRPAISQWDYYQVHVVAKGIPIYASHHMHSNAYDSGKITFP